MVSWKLVVSLIMMISLSFEQSSARLTDKHLAQPPAKLDNQVSPLPSFVANLGTNQVPAAQPTAAFASNACAGASNKCQDDHINMVACFFPAQKGEEESFLRVVNNGENPLVLKVNISSANKTYDNIHIPRHDVKQVNISCKTGGSSSIMLDAGTGKCRIDIEHSAWQDYFNLPSYSAHVTPTNGAYLLGTTAILIGGICICCCKLRKQDRHLDGVAYQELEMGQPELQTSNKSETTDGWNESWDDEWDDEKSVKSPGEKQINNSISSVIPQVGLNYQ